MERIARKATYTIGRLYVDGAYFCDTLEDTDRGLRQGMPSSEISRLKVYGQTAIPAGKYRITLEWSPKFSPRHNGRKMPLLHDVPGFTGILIHEGNHPKDTSGCLLVGRNTVKGMVTDSRVTFERLWPILNEAFGRGEAISIEIK